MQRATLGETVRAFCGVIFDLDGTLIDSLQDIAEAANATLIEQGLQPHPLSAYRYFVGEGVRVLMERAIPKDQQTPELLVQCIERFGYHYNRGWNVFTRPYSGIQELLDELQHRSVSTAVLSNKPDEFTQMCVKYFFPNHRFQAVLGQRTNLPRKPDPSGALWIQAQLALAPHQILFLGDTRIDILTARAAAMYPVGAAWGFRGRKELLQAGAECVLDHPLELLQSLDAPRNPKAF